MPAGTRHSHKLLLLETHPPFTRNFSIIIDSLYQSGPQLLSKLYKVLPRYNSNYLIISTSCPTGFSKMEFNGKVESPTKSLLTWQWKTRNRQCCQHLFTFNLFVNQFPNSCRHLCQFRQAILNIQCQINQNTISTTLDIEIPEKRIGLEKRNCFINNIIFSTVAIFGLQGEKGEVAD